MKTKRLFYKFILLGIMLMVIPLILPGPKMLDSNSLAQHQNENKVVILNYHKVDNMNISLSVLPDDFDQQMAYLKSEGYETISPDQLIDNLKNDAPLPEKPLMITFDDGYADNYENAFPILKKYGFTATIFVVTDFISKDPRFMTWDQVRELDKAGFTIGSHTMQHKSLTDIPDEEILRELTGSKKALEYQLGKPERIMAYPTGTYSVHIQELVSAAGYDAAFTIKYGNVDKASGIYALERVPIFHTETTFKSFLRRLNNIPLFERIGWIKS